MKCLKIEPEEFNSNNVDALAIGCYKRNMTTKYTNILRGLNYILESLNDGTLTKEGYEVMCSRVIKIYHDKYEIDTIEARILNEQARGIILGIEKEFTEPKL